MTARPILAATDGSEDSLRAVAWGAREAALRAVPLMIVSVLAPPPPLSSPWSAESAHASARRATERALVAAVERARSQATALDVATELLHGPPAQVLSRYAERAALLAVGSRGAGGFAAMILGSVSRYAATHAPCPVAVVREETMAVHREVVVGVRDPELPGCAAALAFAFEEAAMRKARLQAVHAWHWPAPAARPHLPLVPDEVVRRLTEALAPYQDKYPGVEVSTDVLQAHPGRVLTGASARADLVVLGRNDAAAGAVHGVGSVTHAVLNHAQGPVAIIPST